jgi:hypothetical protein
MSDVKQTAVLASPPRRRRRSRPQPLPPPPPSREARQRACVILEVLAGGRTPTQAAQALAVSLSRYYLLEDKALQGLLAACEAAPRGPTVDLERQVEALRRDCQRWQRECARQQALVRAAQRTIGVAAPATPPVKEGSRKRKPRRPVARALRAADRLRLAETAAVGSPPGAATN